MRWYALSEITNTSANYLPESRFLVTDENKTKMRFVKNKGTTIGCKMSFLDVFHTIHLSNSFICQTVIIHPSRLTHIYVIKLGIHWFILGLLSLHLYIDTNTQQHNTATMFIMLVTYKISYLENVSIRICYQCGYKNIRSPQQRNLQRLLEYI